MVMTVMNTKTAIQQDRRMKKMYIEHTEKQVIVKGTETKHTEVYLPKYPRE